MLCKTANIPTQLSGTLKIYQKTACQSEKIALGCPSGTSISIEMAQYQHNETDAVKLQCSKNEVQDEDEADNNYSESCEFPNALQHSLLQTAIEACQKKTQCKFQPTVKSFEGNPCPGVRRIVSYAYKCRPYEFRSKVACENEIVQLVCNPYSRIAVYSASYGRTEYESIQCAQPQGVLEETCLVSHATDTVMQLCHGRRRCLLSADTQTFGNPCHADSRMYLKIVYTCVPRGVLNDHYAVPAEPDEPPKENSVLPNEFFEDDYFSKEEHPSPKLHRNLTHPPSIQLVPSVVTVQPAPIESNEIAYRTEDDHPFLFMYIIVAATVITLICIIVIIVARMIVLRRSNLIDSKPSLQVMDETSVPSNVPETASDDIDMAPMSITSISKDNPTCSTYTPSSYANLDPGTMTHTYISANDRPAHLVGYTSTFCPANQPIMAPYPPDYPSITSDTDTMRRYSQHGYVADPAQYYFG